MGGCQTKAGKLGPIAAGLILGCFGLAALAASPAERDLADLSIEELANVEITSVSRRPERLSAAPASIYVITGDDIRRSGAASLPEALRLAPNLQVARIDASQYAISARGFNNSVGNKLLVLIDGRTVYTPLFSGVFWDQQDVMLEDVERIEVISGPGATLWGANAVNGVINVITRAAGDTQGGLVSAGLGNTHKGAAFRYGSALANDGHLRVYGKGSQAGNTLAALPDGREFYQAGFRADWKGTAGGFTLQGDAYNGKAEERGFVGPFFAGRIEVSGFNLLGRWTRKLEGGSDVRLQAYIDHAERIDPVLFAPSSDIYDFEGQHAIPFGRHRLIWGGGYRHGRDRVTDALLTGMRPTSTTSDWANVFVQDEYRVLDEVVLTGGLKFERNDYTGIENLPSVRLAWTPAAGQLLWGAVSRAVRAPSRFDREVIVPIAPGASLGGPSFSSEVAWVYELGTRLQPARNLAWSATLFRHEWEKLRSGTPPPLVLENGIEGSVSGLETWGTWQVQRDWKLAGGLLSLQKNLHSTPNSTDPVGANNVTLGNDADLQWQLRSSHELGARQQFDIIWRYVSDLPTPQVPSYTALDLRYAWRARKDLEFSAVAQNLGRNRHVEFRTSGAAGNQIGRGFTLGLRWTP